MHWLKYFDWYPRGCRIQEIGPRQEGFAWTCVRPGSSAWWRHCCSSCRSPRRWRESTCATAWKSESIIISLIKVSRMRLWCAIPAPCMQFVDCSLRLFSSPPPHLALSSINEVEPIEGFLVGAYYVGGLIVRCELRKIFFVFVITYRIVLLR